MIITRTMAELAEEALQRLGERDSLIFKGERVSNVIILDRARRLHRAFAELGLTRGKVAAMCMVNHPMVYSVFGGIFRTGAAAVPMMFQLTAPELRYIIGHTEAHGVVTDATLVEKVREAVKGLGHVQWLAVLGGADRPDATPREYSLEGLLGAAPQLELPRMECEDTTLMLYTSGTTGRPKGVMLSNSNLMAMAEATLNAQELAARPHPMITLTAMPMAHIFGVGVMVGGYAFPKEYPAPITVQEVWFEAERFMQLIQEYQVTDMPAVPTMLAMMLAHPNADKYDLTSLVKVDVGAAPLPVEVADAFSRKADCFIRQLYGMTENTGLASAGRISKPYHRGSAGLPYVNVELRIYDDSDTPLPPGQAGEIVTRGPSVMKGYFKDPEATANAMRGGWLHTGDIGYVDEEGWLYVVDRKKDMIIKGGENIFPAEVENALYRNPAVAEAAVIGVPHSLYGEDVVAFVVLHAGVQTSPEEIIAQVKKEISSFKAPSQVFFIRQLPKSGVGKILRRELRDHYAHEKTDLAGRPA
jgi:long-chain acyl-CoA synthetase